MHRKYENSRSFEKPGPLLDFGSLTSSQTLSLRNVRLHKSSMTQSWILLSQKKHFAAG